MSGLKVLIAGGGIAGPSLAYWLSRTGARVTIIERSPQRRSSGQQVDIRGIGVTLMKKMGIEAAVRAVTVRESGTQMIDVNGKTKVFFPAAPSGTGKQSITSEFEIMRGDLVDILYGLTEGKENVDHLYDTSIEKFTQDDESDPNGKVHVTFNNGQTADYDLVVGADGTGSRTRRMMLGPDAPDPRHSMGGYIAFYSIPTQQGDWDRFTYCHLPGNNIGRIIATRKDCPELTRVYMFTYGMDDAIDAAHKSGNLDEMKSAWANAFSDGYWQCPRFTDALLNSPEANDLYCAKLEEVRLPIGDWSRGRIVLLGDAAYSHSVDGYGITWALAGAYILAGEITSLYAKDKSSPSKAVIEGANNYEKTYRPIANATEGGASWAYSFFFPKSKLGIYVLHAVAGIMAKFKLEQRAGREDVQAKWKLPEYAELEVAGN
ncbi:hypothetical protein H072_3959 [Dactylellina haptotyla CBS 200.50]|uniref:FAD-binding domain-containing protein n=1 Tax=Dactylellina haptotyla (strain CBS 200.50) TaxID=1284197 RepID=S8C329_DACHA|nr:hypothetical protein H072_3959 [Dactylellina haptotyla CBS 200.50]